MVEEGDAEADDGNPWPADGEDEPCEGAEAEDGGSCSVYAADELVAEGGGGCYEECGGYDEECHEAVAVGGVVEQGHHGHESARGYGQGEEPLSFGTIEGGTQ